jgi:hypothetical protein
LINLLLKNIRKLNFFGPLDLKGSKKDFEASGAYQKGKAADDTAFTTDPFGADSCRSGGKRQGIRGPDGPTDLGKGACGNDRVCHCDVEMVERTLEPDPIQLQCDPTGLLRQINDRQKTTILRKGGLLPVIL